MDEKELKERLEYTEELAAKLWTLTGPDYEGEGCHRGPPGRMGSPNQDPNWDTMIGILAGLETTLEEAIFHILSKKVDCKHKNRFTVQECAKKNRILKHEICRDCEYLIITSNGKMINILRKMKPDKTIYDHVTNE